MNDKITVCLGKGRAKRNGRIFCQKEQCSDYGTNRENILTVMFVRPGRITYGYWPDISGRVFRKVSGLANRVRSKPKTVKRTFYPY